MPTAKKIEPQSPEYELWQKEPSAKNYAVLLGKLRSTIDGALRSYANGDESLRLRANIIATQALGSYDPSKGAKLTTHVMNQLQGLQRFAAERRMAVHIPERQRFDSLAVMRYKQRYREEHGYEPSLIDIQDTLKLSAKRAMLAEGLVREQPASAVQGEMGDQPGTTRQSADQVWADYVYHDLDSVGQKIFEWTTGHNGRDILPKTEIARRLRVTPAAVSARITKILRKLDDGLETVEAPL